MRLVQVLARSGLVSSTQLGSLLGQGGAGDEQVVSYLVETGAISTDQLAQALSVLCGVPPALDRDFARADAALRKRFPVHQATKLRAIPLYVTPNRRVAVAMVEPTHPQILDEVGFVLGAVVEPMVTSEIAYTRQLELLYALPTRRTGFGTALGSDAPTSPVQAKASRVLDLPPLATHAAPVVDSNPSPRREVAATPAQARSRTRTLPQIPTANAMPMFVPADPSAPAEFAPETVPRTGNYPMVSVTGSDSAIEQILAAADRQAAADHLFAFMRSCFGAGAMFVVDGVLALGRFGYNQGLPCPSVESLAFALSLPSCLGSAFRQGALFHGPPPPEGSSIHQPLWNALGCQPPCDVLVAPVVAAGQTPILLYAQGRNGGRIDQFSVGRLEHVSAAVADTLVRLAG